MTTMTIGGSTVVTPTSLNPYGNAPVTRLVPIDGAVIVQTSNNTDNQGEINAPRSMIWDSIPTSSTDWTHTVQSLKALEGTDTTLQGAGFANVYFFSTSITVFEVHVEWIAYNGSTDLWRVELVFCHQ